jgi:hypothetical protein
MLRYAAKIAIRFLLSIAFLVFVPDSIDRDPENAEAEVRIKDKSGVYFSGTSIRFVTSKTPDTWLAITFATCLSLSLLNIPTRVIL